MQNNPDDIKWKDYPLIKVWDHLMSVANIEYEKKFSEYNNEANLKQCPICRQ